ncbi:unnamed protein product [Cochlearia groenlandica]
MAEENNSDSSSLDEFFTAPSSPLPFDEEEFYTAPSSPPHTSPSQHSTSSLDEFFTASSSPLSSDEEEFYTAPSSPPHTSSSQHSTSSADSNVAVYGDTDPLPDLVDELVDSLPDFMFTASGSVLCVLRIINSSNLKRLPCTHIFHKICVDKWLKDQRNRLCPLCRKDITLPQQPKAEIAFEEQEEDVSEDVMPNDEDYDADDEM